MGQDREGGQDLGVGHCHTLGLQFHVPLGHGGGSSCQGWSWCWRHGMGEVLNLAREAFAIEETEIDVEIEETT